jgi:hypothetical protein
MNKEKIARELVKIARELMAGKEGYVVSMTYEIVTPESAESADVAERGFEYKKNKYDTIEEIFDDWDNKKNWVEWSSSSPRSGDWLVSEEERDFSSGSFTTYGLHIERADRKPLSKDEIKEISKEARV